MSNTLRGMLGAVFCLVCAAFFFWRESNTYAIFCVILAVITLLVMIWDMIASKKDKKDK